MRQTPFPHRPPIFGEPRREPGQTESLTKTQTRRDWWQLPCFLRTRPRFAIAPAQKSHTHTHTHPKLELERGMSPHFRLSSQNGYSFAIASGSVLGWGHLSYAPVESDVWRIPAQDRASSESPPYWWFTWVHESDIQVEMFVGHHCSASLLVLFEVGKLLV